MSRLRTYGSVWLWRGSRAAAFAVAMLAVLSLVFIAGCGSSDGGGGQGDSGTPIDAGLPKINLTAPATTGAGETPVFEWEAVSGAGRYRLVVVDGSGAMLWAWNGTDTKAGLGGIEGERPEGTSGPLLTPGSTWSVVAFDAAGQPLAVSDIRPVSP